VPVTPASPGTSAHRWMVRTTVAATVLSLAGLVGFSPFVLESPGPVVNTLGEWEGEQILQISGTKTYDSQSRLDLTTVSAQGRPGASVSALETLLAWIDPVRDIVPREYQYPAGTTAEEQSAQSAVQMTSSQQLATLAALNELDVKYSTSTVIAGFATQANASVLKTGDTIVSFNGASITDPASLQKAVRADTDSSASATIKRDGKEQDVTLKLSAGTDDQPSLGVMIAADYQLPFTIDFAIKDIGGPSAGTMLALGIIDRLTPGSLAGDRHVAGTGTIDPDGTVGAIGGIAQKVVGARNAGATVFLAPAANCAELSGRVPDGLDVYSVSTLSEARSVLEKLESGADTASLQRCG
jgi:Lon-like protease